MTTPPSPPDSESGIALILVVSILAVVSVMATHMVVVSRVSAVEAKVLSDRHRLRHAAESAAERAFWLYLCDRKRFPADHANLLSEAPPAEGRGGGDPWLADGTSHRFELDSDGSATVTVRDANRGYSLQGKNPHNRIRQLFQNLEENEQLRAFLDRLADYVDEDGNTRLDGLERAEYEALGFPQLPRNGPLEFREELLWIPGLAEAFGRPGEEFGAGGDVLDLFQPLPPEGDSFPNARPSVFSASPALLRYKLDSGLGEAESILRAFQRARTENLPLDTLLDPATIQRVQQEFTTGESGIVVVRARASTPAGVGRTVEIVRDCRGNVGRAFRQFRYVNTWDMTVR